MDWIKSLNRAIGYIEDNLLENLSCKDIADQIFVSSFHFQRGFQFADRHKYWRIYPQPAAFPCRAGNDPFRMLR